MEPLHFSHEIGIIAGVFLVGAFALMNFGVLTTESSLYQALNVLGALGFAYTAVSPFNPGLLLTEIVWIVVAVGFMWKIFLRRNRASNETAAMEVAPPSTPVSDEEVAEREVPVAS
ncbi:transporter [Corynebacterium sp. YIM 101645]|uniref:Transporter n=1 Tax=Corynebacterium lemuris TaxID=1859292 RepID=A0ABT2FU71_9CORY|nr:transporter [Corynebacterium lemuris]MCS5478778.1 transporter [Corynebacterium lemuris]